MAPRLALDAAGPHCAARRAFSMAGWPATSGWPVASATLVGGEPGLTEKKMFGGIAFLIGGNMAVSASGRGGMMVRVYLTQSEQAGRDDGRPQV